MTDNNSSPKQLPQLYSLPAIGVATFFGSLLAGGYLISENYRALGMRQLGYITLGVTFVAFCLSSVAVANLIEPAITQEGEIVSLDLTIPLLVNIAQVVALIVIQNIFKCSMLQTSTQMPARFHSFCRPVGMGLVAHFALAPFPFLTLNSHIGRV